MDWFHILACYSRKLSGVLMIVEVLLLCMLVSLLLGHLCFSCCDNFLFDNKCTLKLDKFELTNGWRKFVKLYFNCFYFITTRPSLQHEFF